MQATPSFPRFARTTARRCRRPGLLLALALGLAGCGGGSDAAPPPADSGTPAPSGSVKWDDSKWDQANWS